MENMDCLLTIEQADAIAKMKELSSRLVSPPIFTIPFIKIERISPGSSESPEVVVNRKSDSWVRNYKNMFMAQMVGANSTDDSIFGAGHLNYKDITGTIRYNASNVLRPHSSNNWINDADYGGTAHGVMIGTGSQEETDESFQMDAIIDHGVGVGDMLYYSDLGDTYSWVGGGTRQWTISFKRYFVNRSGASISIVEVGLVGALTFPTFNALIARDVLTPSPVAVADNKACRVTYTFVSHTWDS